GRERRAIAACADVPITFGGTARHNVANALAAIAVASALGLPEEAMRRGLVEFESTPALNPGRGNLWALGGVTAIVDFAHNPHGLEAMVEMALARPAKRRAIVLGQAGDRDDDAIRELARAAWRLRPERVFIKEMDHYRRGRALGEVPAMIEHELARLGAAPDSLVHCDSEMAAVRGALVWADDGDVLLLTTHEGRDEVNALMERLSGSGWRAGNPIGEATPAS
ncbi:MAG TPA: cyanophycin synthetase, partial [Candidatus Eisenbacteria bacterium]|nr:cyanophycin synthetase [Candidatus Eisenbacteria bacterium]